MTFEAHRLEPLPANALHIVIDMQRVFAEETEWHTPALADILPAVTRLAEARPERTLFARFVTPFHAAAAPGRWRHYYERWGSVTGSRLAPGLLDVVAPLASLAAAGRALDKTTYSAFESPALRRRIEQEAVDTVVLSGVETDICVLASLFDAVDRGFRVVLPADAVASGSPEAHAAVLTHILPRMAEQVDVTEVSAVLGAWPG